MLRRKILRGLSVRGWFLVLAFLFVGDTAAMPVNEIAVNDPLQPHHIYVADPATDIGYARGFVYMPHGFSVTTGPASIGIPFPVDGVINIASGKTLSLENDLTLGTTASLSLAGDVTINGNGASILLNGDLTIPAQTITIGEDLVINGRGSALNFASGSSTFKINAGKTLTLKNMVVKGLTGENNFIGSGTLVLQDLSVDLLPETTWTISGGANGAPAVQIKDDVAVVGGGIFAYHGGRNVTFNSYASLYMDLDTTFSWGSRKYGLVMTDTSSRLYLNGCTMYAEPTGPHNGLRLTKGSVIFDNKVTVNNATNADVTRGLVLGSGNTGEDVSIKVLAGARVGVNGIIHHNPSTTG